MDFKAPKAALVMNAFHLGSLEIGLIDWDGHLIDLVVLLGNWVTMSKHGIPSIVASWVLTKTPALSIGFP
jgi:hypothetical protein